jgi:Cu(I)/Ag(I) efflux system membrane protein CusA/SilA
LFQHFYSPILRWCLNYKILFLSIPAVILLLGLMIWLGFDRVFGFVPAAAQAVGIEQPRVRSTVIWSDFSHKFPGLGKEFMPPLDEGSFLFMPTTLPHASIGESLDVLQTQDIAIGSIPEVDSVVGKIGRVDSALDPAPIGMIETVVNYKDEYITDAAGRRINFRYDKTSGDFVRDETGELIADSSGKPYRQWRPHIKSPDDLWKEITAAAQMPSVTSAPKLQPIA